MKQKDFENFITKTSKIIERALNSETNIMGSFFDDDDQSSQSKAAGLSKGDKIMPLFAFSDTEPIKRAITSIEWSPKVNISSLSLYKNIITSINHFYFNYFIYI